jgi:DNA-binding MarR family transcriptional regulator
MLDYDFENSIGHWICNTSPAFDRALNQGLAELQISRQQASVLHWVKTLDNPTQARLAEKQHISTPTLVGIPDRMENAGLIRRVLNHHDRRCHVLRLTPEGVRLLCAGIATFDCVESAALTRLSKREVDSLLALIQSVDRNLRPER